MSLDKDAILEEYRNIRSEILQFNSQAFTAVTLSLGVDITILGWMFSKDNPSKYFYLPVIGFFILFCGCILLLVRNRHAHRLAIFQELFIETRLPDIYWAQAYFLYRRKFAEIPKLSFFEKYGERLADSNVYVLSAAQLVNILVFCFCAFKPLFNGSRTIDEWKVLSFAVIVIISYVQIRVTKELTTYGNIKEAMKEAASQLLCENSNKSGKNCCLGVNTMSNSNKIVSLQTLSSNLLDKTLEEIRLHRKESSPPNEEYFLTAEYLLQEAMEYVSGAWEMVKSGKSNASIALSRWVLEASLNLLWTVAERDKIEERQKVLIGEALRNEACLLEGLAKLWPDKSHQFESKANEARKIRESLGVEKPKGLDQRLEEIRQSDKANWPELYPLYRICCAAAHPSLKVWERFGIAVNSTVSKDPIDKQSIACWMVAASTLYLVTFTYCLTELGDPKQLNDWWENKVRPLLNDD